MSPAQVHVHRMIELIEQSFAERVTLHFLAAALNRQASYREA
jgi:hypothetical protein